MELYQVHLYDQIVSIKKSESLKFEFEKLSVRKRGWKQNRSTSTLSMI